MKILHIISYFQPKLGYEEYFISKEMIKMGHQIMIVTTDRYFPFPNYTRLYKEILGDRKSPKQGFHYEFNVPVFRIRPLIEIGAGVLLIKLKAIIKKFQPDVIHIHGFFKPIALQCLLLACNLSKVKIIVDEHMIPQALKNDFSLRKAYYNVHEKLISLFIKKMNGFYVTKAEVQEYFHDKYNLLPEIIPLGVDIDLFDSSNYDVSDLRYKLGFDGKFVLFYSGKILPNKGISSMLKIASILSKSYDIAILLVGKASKEYSMFLNKKINKNSLTDSFKILPFMSHRELARCMTLGNVGLWLGFPSASINEMISIGRPVIVKHFEGEDLVKKGYNFIKKYNDNVFDAVKWISNIIEDKELQVKLSKEARNYAVQNLDWTITTKRIIDIYNLSN